MNSAKVTHSLLKFEGIIDFHERPMSELVRDVRLAVIHFVVDSKAHHQVTLLHVHNLMRRYAVFDSKFQIGHVEDFPE
jgi:hypothetical protein